MGETRQGKQEMSYDPSNSTVYFDIGEAVATIAILLAFTALANPTCRFRWRLGWFRQRTAYVLFFTAIAFVLFAALLPVLRHRPEGFGGYPIFWELLAGVFFVFGSLGLIICGARPVKFTKRNCEQFFNLCYSVIARGDEKDLGALADEISASAENVVEICGQYDKAHFTKKKGKLYEVSEPTRWACTLLDLWSDRRLCNMIVTRCPDTALRYLHEIQDKRMYHSAGYSFVQQLIREAFADQSSILHREEKYSGLGHFLPFTETVFGRYDFIDSQFRPLQAPGYSHNNLKALEKYSQCLRRAFTAYFEAGRFYEHPSAIWCGVDILTNSAGHFVELIGDGPRPANLEDDPIWALRRITDAFKELLKLVKESDGKLPDYPFDADHYDHFRDYSVYGVIARGIYEYFDKLTRVDGHDEDIRYTAIELWMEIYSPSAGPESKAVLEIQKRLEVLLWEQVNTNLEKDYFCYPMITRLLINLIGLHEHPKASEGEKRVSAHLRQLLKQKFKKATQLSDTRTEELLPAGFQYDEENNQIIQHHKWGQKPTIFQCNSE